MAHVGGEAPRFREAAEIDEEGTVIQARHLSPERVRFERAKAERANFIVSEAISDPELSRQALAGLEAIDRGLSLLWQEFLRWEASRRGQDTGGHVDGLQVHVELRLAPRVRDLVANLPPEDRELFERDILALCANPTIDNVTKFPLPSPPIVLVLYQDGPYRMVYRIHNLVGVDLLHLSWAEDVPTIDEWGEASKS